MVTEPLGPQGGSEGCGKRPYVEHRLFGVASIGGGRRRPKRAQLRPASPAEGAARLLQPLVGGPRSACRSAGPIAALERISPRGRRSPLLRFRIARGSATASRPTSRPPEQPPSGGHRERRCSVQP